MTSGLRIVDPVREAAAKGRFTVTERLVRDRVTGALIREDECVNGGNLVYVPGMEIPLDEARRAGFIAEVESPPTVAEVPVAPTAEPVEVRPAVSRRGRSR